MGKAMLGNPHTPEEARGCESCHGPGRAHVEAGGGKDTISIRFGKDPPSTVAEQNAVCIDCHNRGTHMFWKGSPHESRGIACVDCHQVKQGVFTKVSSDARYSQPLTDNRGIIKKQPELCSQCHQMRRAQLQRSSHMPYREGKVTCTRCHNPHGSPNPKQLIQANTNENWFSCHTERRGPFLFEHPPVLENYATCHEPHGSNNPQLLKVRMPRVCDDCHDSSRHPTQAQPLSSIKNFNRGCTNCHSYIHGSNQPSGSGATSPSPMPGAASPFYPGFVPPLPRRGPTVLPRPHRHGDHRVPFLTARAFARDFGSSSWVPHTPNLRVGALFQIARHRNNSQRAPHPRFVRLGLLFSANSAPLCVLCG